MQVKFKEFFMNKISLTLSLAFAIAFIGCSHEMGHFSMVSTDRNVDWSRINEFMISNEKVTGTHYVRMIVFVVTGADGPEIETTVEKALEKIPGAVALVDVDFKYSWVSAPFYAHTKYIVTGKVLIDPARLNRSANPPSADVSYKFEYDGENLTQLQ